MMCFAEELPASCRQLQASGLCSPECAVAIFRLITTLRSLCAQPFGTERVSSYRLIFLRFQFGEFLFRASDIRFLCAAKTKEFFLST